MLVCTFVAHMSAIEFKNQPFFHLSSLRVTRNHLPVVKKYLFALHRHWRDTSSLLTPNHSIMHVSTIPQTVKLMFLPLKASVMSRLPTLLC